MHVHLQVERALRLMLIAGVTGARVMAGRPDILSFRDRIERGELFGPELYVAGPILEGLPPAGFENEIPIGGAGLTPYQALEAATRNPARFLGRNDGSGTVAAGSPADLVLLDADPLADISNIRRIRGVVRRGTWLDRQALDSLFSAEVRRVTGEPRRQ